MADRFGWIGATRQQAVLDWVASQVSAWWGDWSAVHAAPTIRFEGTAGDEQAVCGNAESRLCGIDLVLATPGPSALAGAFVGVAADAPGALARYVGEEAIEDLARRLSREDHGGPSQQVEATEIPQALLDPKLGCVAMLVAIGGVALSVRLGRRLVDKVRAPERSRSVSLTTRRIAVGEASARLRGQLDLGDIALSQLRSLKPGDVIVTEVPLETLPTLVMDGGRTALVARGQLGEHQGQRALQLLSP